ncbi:metal ABC transporter solute-binding protein, Zn/Mn family [Marinobacterium jannaschii]|uniref:metal ABC transporter solute-binding protein, Zn/Mn family n=1 Tax=Marinobacterium jannaschii TaxID=64970 RepID=UPI00056BADB1|nr:zinc ABC transporter substrate-binding protein [Marinobacterium jannaschii]
MKPLRILLLFFVLFSPCSYARLTVGITLHPYYSYVANIVGDRATLLPLVESGFNPHSYELQPADLKRLHQLDALVVNGIGHDEFVMHAMKTLSKDSKVAIIHANRDVPLLAAHTATSPDVSNSNGAWNPHTFVSISAAIRQIYTIADELGKLDPDNAVFFKRNAVAYARQLRMLKNRYRKQLIDTDLRQIKIASTHNAYGYFLQEFGIAIDTVIEPAHGVEPSASQLKKTIDRIRSTGVDLLFTELDMANRYVSTIEDATGVRLYHFSHMTFGAYNREMVILQMEQNLKTLVTALKKASQSRTTGDHHGA